VSVAPVAIVPAAAEHLPAVQAIYAAAVAETAITFDLEAPDVEGWEALLAGLDRDAGHEMLVAVADGETVGYAKTGSWRAKGAYRTTAETSIYVAEAARGRGIGSLLYAELIAASERSELRNLVAGLTEPNPASTRLHLVHGFQRVGTFTAVGTKFGRSWDVTWYERPLGAPAP
jgi:phosphinothricin acetyltransferase